MLFKLSLVISLYPAVFAGIIENYAEFTSSILKEVSGKVAVNYVVSPANINVLFSLLRLESDGRTEQSFTRVLKLQKGETEQIPSNFANSNPGLRPVREFFIKKNPSLQSDTLETFEDSGAHLTEIDFASDSAAETINKAVGEASEKSSEGKITPDELKPDTSLVVVSGLTYEGKWKAQFPTELVSEQYFTTSDGEVKVSTLNNPNAKLGYYKDEQNDVDLLEIPTESILQLLIILPNDPKQVKNIPEKLPQIIQKEVEEKQVNVSLPAFKIDNFLDVTSIFSALQIPATDNSADFTKIGGENQGDIHISKFFVASSISISAAGIGQDDKKSEGEAVDGEAEEHFNANRPFYFLLKIGKLAILGGSVLDPSSQ